MGGVWQAPNMASHRGLNAGLYELLITSQLRTQLDMSREIDIEQKKVDSADEPEVLSRHVRLALQRLLESCGNPEERLAIVNGVLESIHAMDEQIPAPTSQLLRVATSRGPGRAAAVTSLRPATPLSEAALLTNATGEPALGHELRAELASADRVDLLCAFVKWHGIRLLEAELSSLRKRGVPLRVITTTYLGGTERRALDRLVRDFGAEVRIQFDAQRTRLHAKAWLFERDTQFDTAYVGSSNLSKSALLDGVEWNVRLSTVATPSLLDKFRATFETYWHDPTFRPYDPDRDGDLLDDALRRASGGPRRGGVPLEPSISGLDVRPYPHQIDILERLEVERLVHGRHRNLVVAATGTGKTVVAALDYRRLSQASQRPKLLFVAHRKEILNQSLRTYREVLSDGNFGELYVDGSRPERWEHVFASIQSLTSYGIDRVPPDSFEVVVVDEFHHGAAATYRRLLEQLQPRELLGLTATPERGDGMDVRLLFGGRAAAELRLWDALREDLLTPFHYFGIADNTDLTNVTWRQGAYDANELSNLYTGNHARARLVVKEVHDKVGDLTSMRALCFCVKIDHAEFMADAFNRAGIPSATITSRSTDDRGRIIAELRKGALKAIFTVDVFNEGVDIPEVNTVLFLRPTESATVFLQQLGRGLRTAPGKAVLTALDFVGHHRKEFRFDSKYRALTGATRTQLARAVESGFPFMPAGSQIVLDEATQAEVLGHVRSQVTSTQRQLTAELRAHPTDSLSTFLDDSGAELADVIRGNRSWTALRRRAGLNVPASAPGEEQLLKRVRAFAHVDDPDRAEAYLRWVDDAPDYESADRDMQEFGRMLFFSLWPDGGGFDSYAQGLSSLHLQHNLRNDLREVLHIAFARSAHVTTRMTGTLSDLPLRVHGRYSREEALSALRYASLDGPKPNSFQQGVLYSPGARSDAFFVTLRKSEADYSPTTMYRDYAISPTRFHWESQSVTSVTSPTGRRYLNHRSMGTHILLFSRATKASEYEGAAPYLFLGQADYQEHRGEKPIAITWELKNPMPSDHFALASVVA